MERLLFIWIEDCNERNIPISVEIVQSKALSVFEMLKNKLENLTEKDKEEKFNASKGWVQKFFKRMDLKSESLHGEKASADKEEAAKYPETLRRIIEEGGYSEKQIVNVD